MHFSFVDFDWYQPEVSIAEPEPYSPSWHSATVKNENVCVFVNNCTSSFTN